MAGLAAGDEIGQVVLGAAVLHRYPVVDLVGDAEAAGVFEFTERVGEQLGLADHAPVVACVEPVALNAFGTSDP